jgi:hypothetical protein
MNVQKYYNNVWPEAFSDAMHGQESNTTGMGPALTEFCWIGNKVFAGFLVLAIAILVER